MKPMTRMMIRHAYLIDMGDMLVTKKRMNLNMTRGYLLFLRLIEKGRIGQIIQPFSETNTHHSLVAL
jgi:hypothetical protein